MLRMNCNILLSGRFLGTVSLVFPKFLNDARNPHDFVCDRAGFSRKKCLPSKLENGPKKDFFNLLENLIINFYWIWSKIKIYIICFAPA